MKVEAGVAKKRRGNDRYALTNLWTVMKIKRALKLLYLQWKYRNVDENICCCGSTISYNGYSGCPATCRSMKEYVITTALEKD